MVERPEFDGAAGDLSDPAERIALFELALEAAGAMTWVWEVETDRLSWAGSAAWKMFSVSKSLEHIDGHTFLGVVHPDDRRMVTRRIGAVLASGGSYSAEYRVPRRDGEVRWHVSRGRAITTSSGRVVRLLGVVNDITDRRRTEQALRESEERFRTVLAGAPIAIVAFDRSGRVTLARGTALDTMGVDGDALIGTPVSRMAGTDDDEVIAAVERTLSGETVDQRSKFAGLTFESSYRPLSADDGVVNGGVLIATDVTERVLAEEQLARLALHDPLTDLANRVLFMDRLEERLSRRPRQTRHMAVLFLDLDGFKQINDVHGHQTGDDLLRGVADRLRTSVRPDDTVARFGGDEFLVLSEDCGPREAEVLADRILETVSEPIEIGSVVVQVGVSIGVAIAIAGPAGEADAPGATTLIRQADQAMYRAKQEGRGRFVVVETTVEHPSER